MLLSKEQINEIATKLNKDFDIPFVPEFMEQKIFESAVETVAEKLDEVIPPPMKQLLTELKPDEILKSGNIEGFSERLVQAVNKRVDIPYLDEEQEAKIIRMVVDLVVDCMGGTESLNQKLKKS